MLGVAALLSITLDADVWTPRVDIGGGWAIAAKADASFLPLFVYPDFQSGIATHGGFRLIHAVGARTTLALTARAGATYVDNWRPMFETAAQISWREQIEADAGVRHDERLRREGALADFRDPTGRIFLGVTALPFRKGRLAAGVSAVYERALPGLNRLPSGAKVTIVGRFHVR
jgi:hypothetical protein